MKHARYVLFAFWGRSEDDNIPTHIFPFLGPEPSLSALKGLLENSEIDRDKIISELPFFGRKYSVEENTTRKYNDTE